MDNNDPCNCPPDLWHFGVYTVFTFKATPHVTHGITKQIVVTPRLFSIPRVLRNIGFSFSAQRVSAPPELRRFFLIRGPLRCVTTLRAQLYKLLGPLIFNSRATVAGLLSHNRSFFALPMRSRSKVTGALAQLRAFKKSRMRVRFSFRAQAVIEHELQPQIMRGRSLFRILMHRTRGFRPLLYSRASFNPPATHIKNLKAELKCETTLTADSQRIPRDIVLDVNFT